MNKRHLFSDPIYGLIEITSERLLQLIEHPYFQRLRRIAHLGLTHYVFTAANHSRFSHTLGALHLMQLALDNLRKQGVAISEAEAEAASIAILLHDIGHAPFSHSLEFVLVQGVHHEDFSLALMESLNSELGGQLSLAIRIFKDEYPEKRFLHQLVSSQLDMDRMDYLTRDSFFTGVYEGVVGYDRLIKMLTVTDDGALVVDNKGIYSVENFLIARRLMYWQVYLHKTGQGASELLIKLLDRARYLLAAGAALPLSPALHFFLSQPLSQSDWLARKADILAQYVRLDDYDIWMAIKQLAQYPDPTIQYLSVALLDRKLFKIKLYEHPVRREQMERIRQRVAAHFNISAEEVHFLILEGKEQNLAYRSGAEEINIRLKNGQLRPISKWREHNIPDEPVIKYFVGYPKEVEL